MEISLGSQQVPSPHRTPAPDPLALEQLPTGAKAGTVRASEQLGEMEPIKPSPVPEEGEGNRNQGVSKWGGRNCNSDMWGLPSPQAPALPSCPKAAPHQREGCCCGRGEEHTHASRTRDVLRCLLLLDVTDQGHCNKMAISAHFSVIALQRNALNAPIKRYRAVDWIKIKTHLYAVCKRLTSETHTHTVRGWKKTVHVNGRGKKVK